MRTILYNYDIMTVHTTPESFRIDHAMAVGLGADVFPLDVTHYTEGADLADERLYIGATVEPPRLVRMRVSILRGQNPQGGEGAASFMIKQTAIGPNEDGTELEGEWVNWYTESPRNVLSAFNGHPESVGGGFPMGDSETVQHEAGLIGTAVAAAFRHNTKQRG